MNYKLIKEYKGGPGSGLPPGSGLGKKRGPYNKTKNKDKNKANSSNNSSVENKNNNSAQNYLSEERKLAITNSLMNGVLSKKVSRTDYLAHNNEIIAKVQMITSMSQEELAFTAKHIVSNTIFELQSDSVASNSLSDMLDITISHLDKKQSFEIMNEIHQSYQKNVLDNPNISYDKKIIATNILRKSSEAIAIYAETQELKKELTEIHKNSKFKDKPFFNPAINNFSEEKAVTYWSNSSSSPNTNWMKAAIESEFYGNDDYTEMGHPINLGTRYRGSNPNTKKVIRDIYDRTQKHYSENPMPQAIFRNTDTPIRTKNPAESWASNQSGSTFFGNYQHVVRPDKNKILFSYQTHPNILSSYEYEFIMLR